LEEIKMTDCVDSTTVASRKIAAIEKKIKQLRARKAAEEAKLKQQAKKEDTRRKILLGARDIYEAEKSGSVEELYRSMDNFLTRDNDRKLFGLPPLEN
jgi:vacuolar-type H+-ATPase subunit I/STV1